VAPCENFPQTVARSFGSGWVLPVCRSISRGLGSVKHGACARPALHALHGRTAHDARAGARTRRTRARARGARARARRTHARCTRARARAAAARRARSHARARAHCTLRDTRARTRLPRSPSHTVSSSRRRRMTVGHRLASLPRRARLMHIRGRRARSGSGARRGVRLYGNGRAGPAPRRAPRVTPGSRRVFAAPGAPGTRHAAAQAPSQTDVV